MSSRPIRRALLALLCAATLVRCGGGDDLTLPSEGLPTAIAVLAGDAEPLSGAMRLRTALGTVEVDIVGASLVEAPATTVGAPTMELPTAPAREPDACYDVRAVGETTNRALTLASPAGSVSHQLRRPTRLCVTTAKTDELAARLCYRVQRSAAVTGDTSTAPTTITSALGTATGTLGPVEEICLPADVVNDTP